MQTHSHLNIRRFSQYRKGIRGNQCHCNLKILFVVLLPILTPAPQVRDFKEEVAKLIDVTTCIGCKACQVACSEWNDIRDKVGLNVGVYDNPMDLTAKSWTVMRFSEVEENGKLEWLIRKDGCMHCADPGCLKACPAEGAIVQYANGIVDFQSEHCIGCGYCIAGCPLMFLVLMKKITPCSQMHTVC